MKGTPNLRQSNKKEIDLIEKGCGILLQVTGARGAEGNDHSVRLNSGEEKKVRMGSLAGPESPNP